MLANTNLARAITWMLQDQGIKDAGVEEFMLPYEVNGAVADWPRVERLLGTLSSAELELICVGDQEEWPSVYAKFAPADSEYVHVALEKLFTLIGG